MISQLMVSSKNLKVSQNNCLGTSIESFTSSSPSDQIIFSGIVEFFAMYPECLGRLLRLGGLKEKVLSFYCANC